MELYICKYINIGYKYDWTYMQYNVCVCVCVIFSHVATILGCVCHTVHDNAGKNIYIIKKVSYRDINDITLATWWRIY